MMKVAVFPGTFDPITNGHVDIIQRGAELFDVVHVAVAISARKQPFIAVEDRIELVKTVLAPFDNVQVAVLEGLVVDFASKRNAAYLLRGLRGISDFDYEFQLAGMNQQLNHKIETVFLPAKPEHSYISATIVREVANLSGDYSLFVPTAVAKYLESKK